MRQTLFLAVQLFAAAALALSIAGWHGLSSPCWAAMPVWVVQQAYREDLFLRAVLRVLGTLCRCRRVTCCHLGSAFCRRRRYPFARCWFHRRCSLLDQEGMSYGAFMAGVTLCVVLLPELAGVLHGDDALIMSIDRILCTLIGVACVMAVTFTLTPPAQVTCRQAR